MSTLMIPDVLVWPLMASFVLAGIHVYFGIHVIARNVIFVDLALAQIAALGAVVGMFFGYEHGSQDVAIYLYSIAFTFLGAIIFTLSRSKNQTIPLEAIVGITYTCAFAITLMLLSKSAIGTHELDRLLKGDILWVRQDKVINTAFIYLAVGVLHFLLRKQFFNLSFNYESGEKAGVKYLVYDFIFYMSFGVVVASSVQLVGVFLVFSYLVIPSVISILIFKNIAYRLIFGWMLSAFISYLGMTISWEGSLPSTPLIVILLVTSLIITFITRQLLTNTNKLLFIYKSAGFIAVLGLFCLSLYLFRSEKKDHLSEIKHLLLAGTSSEKSYAIRSLTEHPDFITKEIDDIISEFGKSTDRQIIISLCDFFKQIDSQKWNAQIINTIRTAGDNDLSCYLELVSKKQIYEAENALVDRLKTASDSDIELEIFGALLDLHSDDAVKFITEKYAKAPSDPQYQLILDLLNNHYHKSFKTIPEFWEWKQTGK